MLQPLCSCISHLTIWTKCSVLLTDIILVSWFYKILRCWTFCGWNDIWVVPHHCCSILKGSWRSFDTLFRNFPLVKIPQCITTIPESLYDSIYNQASQLWGNNAPLQTALGYGPFQRASSEHCCKFSTTQHGASSLLECFFKPCCVAALMSGEELSEASSISRKALG